MMMKLVQQQSAKLMDDFRMESKHLNRMIQFQNEMIVQIYQYKEK